MIKRHGMQQRLTILFAHYGENWIRGSERVLLDLMAGLDPRQFRAVLWCNTETMAAEARALGVKVHVSPMAYFLDYASPRLSPRMVMRLMAEARRIIRQEKVDCVHANSAAPCQWLAPVARSMGIPMLAHLHANYLPRSRYVCLLHLVPHLVGVSRYTLRGLQDDGLPQSRTEVIPNGIDWIRMSGGDHRSFRQELGIAAEDFVILAVGSLIPRKGHDRLMAALQRLPPEVNAHLVIVGEGNDRGRLEARIAELGLAGRVHLLGSRSALAHMYMEADCFALASHDEAYGLVFAEAGYCGLPSLGMRCGGVPDVVQDGITGFLVEPGEEADVVAALAGTMSLLAQDPALRVKLGDAARAYVMRNFDSERMIEAFASAYRRLTTSPSLARGWRGIELDPYRRMLQKLRPSLGI
jgi:glycosyltransferase involved in cell wall biosynthesis